MPSDLLALAESEYVLLTTFRANGDAVGTPVWIARDGDELLVTTGGTSGKVKRLAHTPRVTLMPCDVRGIPRQGAAAVEATAVVDDTPETRTRLERAFLKKYGVKFRLVRATTPRKQRESVSLVIRAV